MAVPQPAWISSSLGSAHLSLLLSCLRESSPAGLSPSPGLPPQSWPTPPPGHTQMPPVPGKLPGTPAAPGCAEIRFLSERPEPCSGQAIPGVGEGLGKTGSQSVRLTGSRSRPPTPWLLGGHRRGRTLGSQCPVFTQPPLERALPPTANRWRVLATVSVEAKVFGSPGFVISKQHQDPTVILMQIGKLRPERGRGSL